MLPSPSSSPRDILANRTNVYPQDYTTPTRERTTTVSSLLTPPEDTKLKRCFDGTDDGIKKRAKLAARPRQDTEEDSDIDMDDDVVIRRRGGTRTVFGIMNAISQGRPGGRRISTLPTRSILQSFVCSHKSDVYKCISIGCTFMTVPYACSFSHAAKKGGTPTLAVATEQGTVHIINTSKRRDWDPEPPRTTFQPHANGIFDIKWNPADTLIATASGDQTAHISCPTTQRTLYTLRGHQGTVKCLSWDPSHTNLLGTGGRDGKVCIWDMRIASKASEDGLQMMSPVISIEDAHGKDAKVRGRKAQPLARGITSLVYPEGGLYGLISSGSFDGILRYWDLRLPAKKSRSTKPKNPPTIVTSPLDPTALNSRRPRGITSMTLGTGPSSGLIFAVGADSNVHSYSLPSLAALPNTLTHPEMQTNSFYVQNSISPCGRWLASGSTGSYGDLYLFDVSNVARMGSSGEGEKAVRLGGQQGEIGAVDWADGCVASCADDGTIRIWRPDLDVRAACWERPQEWKWHWSWALGS